MFTVTAEDVNWSYPLVLATMRHDGIHRSSRNGDVLQLPYGLAVTHTKPLNRVLFDIRRDANPFFHLLEAMWMLCGRSDVEFVARYAKQMTQYSDDGQTLNGAYGYRWRNHFDMGAIETDQLLIVVEALRKNKDDRRQVISMWDPATDLVNAGSKDLPCNLSAVPQIGPMGALNLTVFNRSNDVVWGMLGANVVHFSFLLEYLAARIGVPVGYMTQVSANPHLYIDRHAGLMKAQPETDVAVSTYYDSVPLIDASLGEDPEWFDAALEACLYDEIGPDTPCGFFFLDHVVLPMMRAHRLWRAGARIEASTFVSRHVKARSWATAAIMWMERRISGPKPDAPNKTDGVRLTDD